MSTQHTCYPPLVVNSNGDVIRNSQRKPKPEVSEGIDNLSDCIVFEPEPEVDGLNGNAQETAGNDENFNISEYIMFDPEISSSDEPVPMATSSPVAGPSGYRRTRDSPGTEEPENMMQSQKKRKKRYSQQDMFEFFRRESKQKRKETRNCLMLLKSIAESQNISVPSFDNSSSWESE